MASNGRIPLHTFLKFKVSDSVSNDTNHIVQPKSTHAVQYTPRPDLCVINHITMKTNHTTNNFIFKDCAFQVINKPVTIRQCPKCTLHNVLTDKNCKVCNYKFK